MDPQQFPLKFFFIFVCKIDLCIFLMSPHLICHNLLIYTSRRYLLIPSKVRKKPRFSWCFRVCKKSLMVLNYCNITPDRVHVIDFFQNVIFRMIFSHLKPFSCLNFLRTFSVRFSGLPQFLIGLQYFHFHGD